MQAAPRWLKLLILPWSLVACSDCGGAASAPATPPAPPTAAPTAPAAPPAEAEPLTTARLAYAKGSSLCIQNLLPTGLGEGGCAHLTAAVDQLSWAGADAVAALLASGDVVLVGAVRGNHGIRKLPLPPDSTWDRPPPRDGAGKVQRGADPSSEAHLFVKGEEVWLARCPWWFGFDAGWCHEWVSQRLHPAPATEVSQDEPPGFREHTTPLFDAAPPAGVRIAVQDVGAGPGDPPGDRKGLVCERSGARSVFVPEAGGYISIAWTWIPGSDSLYLATVERDYGEATLWTTYLMKACEQKPSMELSAVSVGPDRYWIHAGDEGWIVRYGDREIGRIDGDAARFAPERR